MGQNKSLKNPPKLGLSRGGKYVKWMAKLKSTIIENLSTFSMKNEIGKLEKDMHKTGTFLSISKEEGSTITATALLYQLLECN